MKSCQTYYTSLYSIPLRTLKSLKKYDTNCFLKKGSRSLHKELSGKIKIFSATLHLRSNIRE